MIITPYTNLNNLDLEECKKLESLNVLITMQRDNGEVFYILTHESQKRHIPKNHAIFWPQELLCLGKIQDKDMIESVMMAKRFLGAKLICSGKATSSIEDKMPIDIETMRQKVKELERKKKEEKKLKKGCREHYKF